MLLLTGAAKVWSASGNSKFLSLVNPIIGIKFGHLFLMVGMVEIAIALICFFGKRQSLALGLVAWLSTNFVVYRLGPWWLHWNNHAVVLATSRTLSISLRKPPTTS